MSTRLAFNYEPVRFDVDPPEDWQPSLRSQEEVDDLFWDQLLNKGKRAANTFMDFWYGSTPEEEAQTAMEELAALNAMPYGGPLIALVGRKTLGELLRRVQSRAGLERGAEASYHTRRGRPGVPPQRDTGPPGSLLERWYKKNPDQGWPERRYPRDDDEIIPVPEDTVLHEAARWVSERYPRMMSHVADATVDPRLKGYGLSLIHI